MKSKIEELDFYGWKSTGMKENPTDVPMEDVFVLRQDVIKLLAVEDAKQGGEVSKEQIFEECRLYAEDLMYSKSWDRKDAEMVGVFYKFFIDKLWESIKSQPYTPVQPEEIILLNEKELEYFDSILVDLNQNKISVDNATEKLLTLIFERKGTPASTPVQDGKLGGAVELQLIEYWRDRCLAAEVFIKESPCDPDITANQIDAYNKWQDLNKSYPPSQPSTPVQDGWVRVEDGELPEHETVLVKIGDDTILLGICNSEKEWAIYYSDGRNAESVDRPVTHWMKLPEPPNH